MPAMTQEKRGSLFTKLLHIPNLFQNQWGNLLFMKEVRKELLLELNRILKIEMKDRRIAGPKIEITQIQARNQHTLDTIVQIQITLNVKIMKMFNLG